MLYLTKLKIKNFYPEDTGSFSITSRSHLHLSTQRNKIYVSTGSNIHAEVYEGKVHFPTSLCMCFGHLNIWSTKPTDRSSEAKDYFSLFRHVSHD